MKEAVILIPSYEPDDLLVNVVNELVNEDFPVLVVNDGSGREFDRVFEQVKDKVQYISYETNKGKGYAMRTGYKQIPTLFPEAKFVITADGDGQHTLKDIKRVYSKTTRSLLTKQYIQDDQCGLRGFPVRYIPDLLKIKGNRYEYEMNQMCVFQLMQAPIYTLPIETIYLDNNSRSHFSPFKDTFRIQTIIFLHSIAALLCTALLMFLLIVAIKHEVFPLVASVYLCYTATFLLYFLLLNIFYPTKSFFRRLFKELFFVALKMETTHLLLELTLTVLHWNYNVMVPIVVFISCTLNVLFSWLLRKMFPSF